MGAPAKIMKRYTAVPRLLGNTVLCNISFLGYLLLLMCNAILYINHTLAQCEHVLKATKQVNGKGQNSIPRHAKTPLPIFTKIGKLDYVLDGTRHANFCSDRFRVFLLPKYVILPCLLMWLVCSFFWVLQ